MKGQAGRAGSGRKGSTATATRPEAAATRTVVSSLSVPPLTMAFQVACSAAPRRTAAKTVERHGDPGPAGGLYAGARPGASGRAEAGLIFAAPVLLSAEERGGEAWPPGRAGAKRGHGPDLRLAAEFLALFVGRRWRWRWRCRRDWLWPVFLGVDAGGGGLLARTPGFAWRELAGARVAWARGRRWSRLATAVAARCWSGGWFPDRRLALPRRAPGVWLTILLLYPLLSALPQELIFRVLFFRRYGRLFAERRVAVAANALVFGLAHLMFWNWVAVALTVAGGLVFARAYLRRAASRRRWCCTRWRAGSSSPAGSGSSSTTAPWGAEPLRRRCGGRLGEGRVVQGGVLGEVELGVGEAGHRLGDVGAGQRHAGLVAGELQVEDVDARRGGRRSRSRRGRTPTCG